MLADADVVSRIPSFKHDEARAFYTETLGLELTYEDGFGMSFSIGGRTMRLTKVREAYTPYPFSILWIQVKDIAAEMAVLSEKGVTFERYEVLEQDEQGVCRSPAVAHGSPGSRTPMATCLDWWGRAHLKVRAKWAQAHLGPGPIWARAHFFLKWLASVELTVVR